MTTPLHRARPGTIVLLRFPLAEGRPGKIRPCLVIACQNGGTGLTLAYGTAAPDHANSGLDLPITAADDLQAAGLRRPTRFVLARRITVAASDPRFDVGPEATPVIGKLPAPHLPGLTTLCHQIGPDLTADRPRGRSRKRQPGQKHNRHVTVQTSPQTKLWRHDTGTSPNCPHRRASTTRIVIVEYRSRRKALPPSAA
ncbi:MAG: hypothetical protein Q4G24_13280 [Paracoccus sp. (in: a-proteobacteria)]|uniref:hypothetical protein n=1 Tax=Paracoccus sp. TaxID=267 RepID=UPI0026E0C339|nr:hypothetical protein [Paracoccus sp. (in: a-proteobacteria)]MDO5622431.1 hypothetical protein [Paracoccus sp. (in: a-proteobacteria)]